MTRTGFASTPRLKWAIAAVVAGITSVALSAPVMATPPSGRTTQRAGTVTQNWCKKVPLATITAVLGKKATKVTPQVGGTSVVCWYTVAKQDHAVFVRYSTNYTVAKYNADKKLSQSTGQHPKADSKFAPYQAFSSYVGSAAYGYTYSVTVLKKSNELQVGASNSTLAKMEALTKKILPVV